MEISKKFKKDIPESFETELQNEKNHCKYTSHSESSQIRIILITLLSVLFRMIYLGHPDYVSEIELEMGKQVNWYMAGKYFIGKFPPLSSLINTGLAYFLGYYGDQDLVYTGQPFSNFPLLAMRRVSALLGALVAPLCYMTLCNLNHSQSTALLAALLVVFENGAITQSRFASPEAHVLFLSALTIWSWSMVYRYRSEGKSNVLVWQLVTGLCIGLSMSAKWTGVILLPVIWCSITLETWNNLTDNKNTFYACIKKVYVYLFTVGVLPLWIYMLVFKLHFSIATESGDHDLLLSSSLRYSLKGNAFEPSQVGIAYGSQIVIKHNDSPGGYLHSHHKRLTGGSTQQEVTLYPYVDLNNVWTVHKVKELYNSSQPLEYVRHGDHIRLEHFASSRKLHSHDTRPQLSTGSEHHEVTAYGDKLTRDVQDYWSLVLLDENNKHVKDKNVTWRTLDQSFRLLHIRGCALISHGTYYTTEHQHQEVTCMVSAGIHVSSWSVESAYHEKLQDLEYHSFKKMEFYQKLIETHKLMIKYPSLVYDRLGSPNPVVDGTTNPKNILLETPLTWFFKKTNLKIWYEFSGRSVHLVLNSNIQKFIVLSVFSSLLLIGIKALVDKRQMNIDSESWFNTTATNLLKKESILFFFTSTLISIQGIGFLPSYIISLSDMLPAVYCGVMLASACFENLCSRLPRFCRYMLSCSILAAVLFQTWTYSRLIYGHTQWNRSACEASGWNIQCIHFPLYPHELEAFVQDSGQTPDASALTVYFGLLGKSEPFRYEQGQEDKADEAWALVKQSAYEKESARLTGTHRYHRVDPTPGITIEEATEWAKAVHEGAIEREKASAEERKQKKALKKKKQGKKKPRTKKQSDNTNSEPL